MHVETLNRWYRHLDATARAYRLQMVAWRVFFIMNHMQVILGGKRAVTWCKFQGVCVYEACCVDCNSISVRDGLSLGYARWETSLLTNRSRMDSSWSVVWMAKWVGNVASKWAKDVHVKFDETLKDCDVLGGAESNTRCSMMLTSWNRYTRRRHPFPLKALFPRAWKSKIIGATPLVLAHAVRMEEFVWVHRRGAHHTVPLQEALSNTERMLVTIQWVGTNRGIRSGPTYVIDWWVGSYVAELHSRWPLLFLRNASSWSSDIVVIPFLFAWSAIVKRCPSTLDSSTRHAHISVANPMCKSTLLVHPRTLKKECAESLSAVLWHTRGLSCMSRPIHRVWILCWRASFVFMHNKERLIRLSVHGDDFALMSDQGGTDTVWQILDGVYDNKSTGVDRRDWLVRKYDNNWRTAGRDRAWSGTCRSCAEIYESTSAKSIFVLSVTVSSDYCQRLVGGKILAASTSRGHQQTAEIPVRICCLKSTVISHGMWLREGRRRLCQFFTKIILPKDLVNQSVTLWCREDRQDLVYHRWQQTGRFQSTSSSPLEAPLHEESHREEDQVKFDASRCVLCV